MSVIIEVCAKSTALGYIPNGRPPMQPILPSISTVKKQLTSDLGDADKDFGAMIRIDYWAQVQQTVNKSSVLVSVAM